MKKILQPLIIFIFILIFSLIFGEQYFENYKNNTDAKKESNILSEKVDSFDLSKINSLEDTQFYYTPYKKLLDKIVNKIDSANNRVYVEVYILTETRIKEALVRAKNRGLDVKVLLEKNPYKANNINNKHYKFLEKNFIDVKWSDPDDYSLNHSKFMIVDDYSIVSTGNFTYSSFIHNRDMFIISKDKNVLNILLKIFKKDFAGDLSYFYDDNFVISPTDSRDKFSKLFLSSKDNIKIYFQYLKDDNLENILINRAQQGIKVDVIVSENFYTQDYEEMKKLENHGINISYIKKPKMHSKAILIDDKYLFIGSINFSEYSLDKNREIGLILTNKDIISKFSELFKKDKNEILK